MERLRDYRSFRPFIETTRFDTLANALLELGVPNATQGRVPSPAVLRILAVPRPVPTWINY
jgi:hypothetical protein